MNRICGVRGKNHISRTNGNQHQVRKPFLDTDSDNGFRIRVNIHIKTPFIPIGYRQPQPGNTHGCGIAVIGGFLGGFHQFVNDMAGGSQIRVSHSQVYDIFSRMPGFHLDFIDGSKNIGRKSV